MKKLAFLSFLLPFSACRVEPFIAPQTADYESTMESSVAENIIQVLHSNLNSQNIPAISVYIENSSNESLFGAVGTQTLKRKTAVQKENLFRIASMSKFYTSILVLRYVENGTLSLEDPVSNWINGFPNGEQITLRQLLSHTSGVPDLLANFSALIRTGISPKLSWKPVELVDLCAEMESDFAPGSDYKYSNGGFALLAFLLEQVSGKSFQQIFDEEIGDPLGLQVTVAVPNASDSLNLVPGFDRDLMPYPNTHKPTATSWSSFAFGSGGMISRPDEMATVVKAAFDGSLLSAASLSEMTNFSDWENEGNPEWTGYGLGLMRIEIGNQIFYGHEGLFIGFEGVLLYSPALDLTLVLVGNVSEFDYVSITEDLLALL